MSDPFDSIERWGSAPGPRDPVRVDGKQWADVFSGYIALDFGDSLYEPRLAIQEPVVEIPVTDEMRETGGRAGFELYYGSEPDTDAIWRADKQEWVDRAVCIYRAMAAVAPTELYREDERRIDVLVAQVAELEDENKVWNAVYGSRPDSLFSARQKIAVKHDEALVRAAALEADNMSLRSTVREQDMLYATRHAAVAELDAARVRIAELEELLSAFQFPDSVSADLPDPPRRPDGTLVPAAKPWSAPRPAGDARRIGG